MMTTIRIALVDDHKLFRDGLAELIHRLDRYEVVIEADHGLDLQEKLQTGPVPDIVILDINMKGMDGYETAQWLRERCPEVRVLVLSMYENETAIIRMLRLGARGYLLKDIRRQELEKALDAVMDQGFYFSDLVTGKLVHILQGEKAPAAQPAVSINARETVFLKWACSELTYKDIADKMNVSVHTVDGYREALFEKLHAKSRVGLVLYAIRHRIFLVD